MRPTKDTFLSRLVRSDPIGHSTTDQANIGVWYIDVRHPIPIFVYSSQYIETSSFPFSPS